ncbi:hypothetical protein NQD34_002194 [Periophthalmus magnuspinnatus]|nr:hypothetical protein NQD34_002194 [Periophthalmus magnuspinnatus]
MKLGEIIVSIKRVKKVHYTIPVLCTWLPVQSHRPLSYRVRAHSSGPHCILTLFFVFPPKQSHFSPPEHSRKVSHGGIESTGSAKNVIKLVSGKCPMPPDSTAPPKNSPLWERSLVYFGKHTQKAEQ